MRLQVYQNRPIPASFPPGEVVHTHYPWGAGGVGNQAFGAAEQGGAAGGKLHRFGKTHASLAAKSGSHALQKAGRGVSTPLIARGKRREVFSKRLARASRVGAAKAPRVDLEDDRAARTGKTVEATNKPAMSRLSADLTHGTGGAQPGRNQGDDEVWAFILDGLHQEIGKVGEEVCPGHASTPLLYAETSDTPTLAHLPPGGSKGPLP